MRLCFDLHLSHTKKKLNRFYQSAAGTLLEGKRAVQGGSFHKMSFVKIVKCRCHSFLFMNGDTLLVFNMQCVDIKKTQNDIK